MGATTSRTHLFTDYEAFVGKFAPKKTTDDCYTPPEVYDEVLAWCRAAFTIPSSAPILRPFKPGGDFEAEDYPTGGYVIDNPPFSILSRIVSFYVARGIHFALFAPTLTLLTSARHCNAVAVGANVTYANGAKINTSLLTDLGTYKIRTAPDLCQRLKQAQEATKSNALPTYDLPENVLTSARLGTLAAVGIDLRVGDDACAIVGNIDAMRRNGKSLYGGGVLLGRTIGERIAEAREKAEAHKGGFYAFALSSAEDEAARRFDAAGGAVVGFAGNEG